MRTGIVERPVIDLRGVFDADAMLELVQFADCRPGEQIEVIGDDPAFAVDLLRWCGEGYGRIESVQETAVGDRFLVQLPTREACSVVGIGTPA